ncbi:nitroreductase family protein [Enterococcus faecalis]|uniref:nitroreductase family protein n=1 Tax=Enterococcus faecalis TaxID=1351 RepID=UPI001E5C7CD1|nr:nitroreductase family protein [Enterococcus faecalis]
MKKLEKTFNNIIRERKSVRLYDPTYKMNKEEISQIINDALLAPSGMNLQPWRFMIFSEQELQEQILPIALGQQQVVDASAVIFVLGDKNAYTVENANKINQRAVNKGFMPDEVRIKSNNSVDSFFKSDSEQDSREKIMLDCGLVSMQLMLSAKSHGYDTIPMLGYDEQAFRETFEIPDNLVNVLMIVLGKAKQPGFQTIRLTTDEVTSWNVEPKK